MPVNQLNRRHRRMKNVVPEGRIHRKRLPIDGPSYCIDLYDGSTVFFLILKSVIAFTALVGCLVFLKYFNLLDTSGTQSLPVDF